MNVAELVLNSLLAVSTALIIGYFFFSKRLAVSGGEKANEVSPFLLGAVSILAAKSATIFAGNQHVTIELTQLIVTAGLLGGGGYALQRIVAKLVSAERKRGLRFVAEVGSYVPVVGGGVALGIVLLAS